MNCLQLLVELIHELRMPHAPKATGFIMGDELFVRLQVDVMVKYPGNVLLAMSGNVSVQQPMKIATRISILSQTISRVPLLPHRSCGRRGHNQPPPWRTHQRPPQLLVEGSITAQQLLIPYTFLLLQEAAPTRPSSEAPGQPDPQGR